MTTPKRLLDEQSGADDFERAILRSDLDVPVPAGAETDVLKRVMAVVAPVAPPVPSPPGVETAAGGMFGAGALAKSAATLGGLGKGFALGVGVSIAAATGSHLLDRSTAPAPTPSAPIAAVASSAISPTSTKTRPAESSAEPEAIGASNEAPTAATSLPTPPPSAPPAGASTPVAVQTPGASSIASFPSDEASLAASRLKEEAALLRRARAELRAGALGQAFATLEASRRSFTAPELSQEREALLIELLYRSGERAAAAARARDFLARFPESPHASAVRAFTDDTPR